MADSALYTTDKLLANPDYLWLTRVPETVKEAREWVSRPEAEIGWLKHEGGYKFVEVESHHGGMAQRWLLIYSEQAYAREKKTLDRNLEKEAAALKKEIWHLGNLPIMEGAFLRGMESTMKKREQNQQGVESGIFTLPERESLHYRNATIPRIRTLSY